MKAIQFKLVLDKQWQIWYYENGDSLECVAKYTLHDYGGAV